MFPPKLTLIDSSYAATYYNAETGNAGACGKFIKNSQHAVALNPTQYNKGANCGKTINVKCECCILRYSQVSNSLYLGSADKGKSVTATVMDLCPECHSGSIDLTPSAFKELAPLSDGRIKVEWEFA